MGCLLALACLRGSRGLKGSMQHACFAVSSQSLPRPPRCAALGIDVTRSPRRAQRIVATGRSARTDVRMLSTWFDVRGVKSSDSSRLFAIAQELQVKPPLLAPKWVWKMAWETFRVMLKALHAFDPLSAWDNHFNLSVLWWKAIAGNTRGSKVADGGVAYDMLPALTRWIVGWPLCLLFPRLHHQNVAMRTSFLSRECDLVIRENMEKKLRTRMVVVGAGFDTRGFSTRGIERVIEIDLPAVASVKQRMLHERLFKRRPSLRQVPYTSIGVDLNQVEKFEQLLEEAIASE